MGPLGNDLFSVSHPLNKPESEIHYIKMIDSQNKSLIHELSIKAMHVFQEMILSLILKKLVFKYLKN
ncbi:MAG: hypothetical protein ACTSYC_05365 [Promethearchaeota archaeon]